METPRYFNGCQKTGVVSREQGYEQFEKLDHIRLSLSEPKKPLSYRVA